MTNVTTDSRAVLTAIKASNPTNSALYEAGKRYTKRLDRLKAGGKKKAGTRDVAAEFGLPAAEVEGAIKFADAVDWIAANCGGKSRKLLLSGHPRLSARVVMQISRKHPDRQLFALSQAEVGRHPLGKPLPGVAPPFDTLGCFKVLSRLPRNAGALDWVADGLRDTSKALWPPAEKLAAILERTEGIRRYVRSMKPRVAASAVAPSERAKKNSKRKVRPQPAVFDPKRALSPVALAAGVTAKNVRDLPRVLAETPPTATEKESLLAGLRRLDASAARLIAVINARDHDWAAGPSEVPGTYVVFFHLSKSAKGLKIGALGTFDFPAGYYAYLGSAFGAGGVRKRTHRHLTRRSMNNKWNIDHLKPLCTPVAVWWTHDRHKVEFDWANVLESLPGASFPAPKFGSADNKSAKAHLVHFAEVPSFAAFRRRVKAAMKGHAQVHEKTIENWTGCGWPV